MVDELGRGHYQVEVDAEKGADTIRDTEKAISGVGDTAARVSGEASGHFSKFGTVAQGAVMGVGLAVGNFATNLVAQAPIAVLSKMGDAIQLASDKAESASKAQQLFGASTQLLSDASRDAAETVGMSSGRYLEMAGNLGNLLVNFDITGDAAAGMSKDMIALAADVGSFNNADPTEVVEAMGAAFRGESEPIRRFGVMLDEASIKEKALEMGLYSGTGAIDKNAKAQATYALILDQTAHAQGDFARTSDGLANQQRIAAARQEEAWTRLGDKLYPIAQTIMPLLADAMVAVVDGISGVVSSIMEWVGQNQELFDVLGDLVGIIGGALGFYLGVFMAAVGDLATRLGGLVGVVINVLGALVDLGGVIVKVFSGDFEGAAASAESAMSRIGAAGDDMKKAIEGSAGGAATATKIATDDMVDTTDAGMRAMTTTVEDEGQKQLDAAQGTAEGMVDIAAWGGSKTPGAFSDAARKGFDDVETAFSDLRDLMKNTLSPAKQEAELIGIATSKRLAKGLSDTRPEVHAKAEQIALDAIARLQQLNPKSEAIGHLAMKLLASASEAEKPAIREAISKITGVASDELDKLPGMAEKSGQKTVYAFAAGMTGAQSRAIYAASNLAGRIAGMLELGSPAKEGPWSRNGGPEAWMANAARKMTTALAAGLRDGSGDVAAAWADVAAVPNLIGPAPMLAGVGGADFRGEIELTVRDPDGGLARAGITTTGLSGQLSGQLEDALAGIVGQAYANRTLRWTAS